MATYEVDVGGKTYEVDAPDPNTAWQWANYTHRESDTAEPKKPTEGALTAGFKSYLPGIQEAYGGLKTLAGVGAQRMMGEGEVSKALIESGAQSMKEAKEKTAPMMTAERGSFGAALDKGVGAVLSEWLPYQVGSGAANLIESLAITGAGALVGSAAAPGPGTAAGAATGLFAKELAKRGIKEAAEKILAEQGEKAAQDFFIDQAKQASAAVGKKIGATVATTGMAGMAATRGAGEVTGRAVEEAEKAGGAAYDIDLGRVLPAASVHAVAEFISDKIGLGALDGLGKEGKNYVYNISKNILVAGTKESPTEIAQTAAERYGANLSLTDAQAIKEYADAAAASYAMSTVPGTVGGVRETMAARADKPPVALTPEAPPVTAPAMGVAVPEELAPLTFQEKQELARQQVQAKPVEDVLGGIREQIKTETPTTAEDVARIRNEHEDAVMADLMAQDEEMRASQEVARRQLEALSATEFQDEATQQVTERIRESRLMSRVQSLIDMNIPFASTAINDINQKFGVINEAPLTETERERVQNIMGMAQAFTNFVNLPTIAAPIQDQFAQNQALEQLIKEKKDAADTLRAAPTAPSNVIPQAPVSEGVVEGESVRPEGGFDLGAQEDRKGRRLKAKDLTKLLADQITAEPTGLEGTKYVSPEEEELSSKIYEIEEAKNLVNSISLLTAIKGKVSQSEVSDISPDKIYKTIGKKGAGSVSDLVDDGLLDNFLPPNMRHDSARYDSAESTEYIKEKLRNKDHLTYDAEMEIQGMDRSIRQLEDEIAELLEIEDVNRLIVQTQAELAEEAQAAISERPTELAAPSAAQDEGFELKPTTPEGLRLKAQQEKVQPEAPEGEFVLTGSERAVDEARARGQMELGGDGDIRYQRSANFKKWFGDSKVVDADGKPLVVYHGTMSDISEFDVSKQDKRDAGFWFGGKQEANNYAASSRPRGENVIPVYLSITNPKIYYNRDIKITPELIEKLKADGYDGVMRDFANGPDAGRYGKNASPEWAAFDPTQIKSATGNIGTYDPTNPDIRYQRSAAKGKSIGIDQTQSIVDAITSRWENAPEVVVAKDMDNTVIPEAVRKHNQQQLARGAKGSPKGFFYKGKAYIIADSMTSANDVMETLFHESLGHYGLRGTFGAEMNKVLSDLVKNRKKEVEAKAEQYGLDPKNEAEMLEAAEEVLAEMAQTKPGLPFVKRAIAAIRNFFRSLGLPVKMSDNDIIQKYILPARAFVETGKRREVGGKAAASREAPSSIPAGLTSIGYKLIPRGDGRRFKGFGTWEKDGVRVALSGDLLMQERGTVQKYESDGDAMTVEAVISDADVRGQGRARKAIQDVIRFADEIGKDLYLEPVQLEKESGLTRDQLVKFYSSLGFKPTDASGLVMERKAKPVAMREAAKTGPTTAAFKKWFGDSKVVDADGKPLVVYHGTNKDITKFKGSPVWVTSDPALANRFVAGGRRKMGDKPGKGSAVYPLYVSIKNPVDLRGLNLGDDVSVTEILNRAGVSSANDVLEKIARHNLQSGYAGVSPSMGDPVQYLVAQYAKGRRLSNTLDDPGLRSALEDAGADGFILSETYANGTGKNAELVSADTYAVFSPTQIKSATGNIGTYDPTNPDIRYQRDRAQESIDILEKLGRTEGPEPTITQRIKTLAGDTVDNPRRTAATAATATNEWVRKAVNKVLSADAAIQDDYQKYVRETTEDAGVAMKKMIESSLSQTYHANAVAGTFLEYGSLDYSKEAHKWEAKKDGNNFIKLVSKVNAMADRLGMTHEVAQEIAHRAAEAKRLRGWMKYNDSVVKKVEELRAEADRIEGKSPVAASELRDKATRELAKKKTIHMTPEQIALGEQLFDLHPELKEISDIWNGIRKNASDVMIKSGLWSQEEADELLSNMDYVPFYREMDEGDGSPKTHYNKLKVDAKEKRATGSYRPVNNIIDNQFAWVQHAISRAVKNKSAVSLADAAIEMKAAKQVQKTGKPSPKSKLPVATHKENVTRIWRDGKEEFYEMDDPLYMDAFNGLESVAIPGLKWAKKIADTLRSSVVMYPMFTVAQLPQDAFAAMFSSGLNPRFALKVPMLAVKEFIQTYRNASRTHEHLKKFGAVGVRDYAAAEIRIDAEVMAGLKGRKGFWPKVADKLHHFAMAGENAVRQAVYIAAKEQGLSEAEAVEKTFEIFNARRRGTSRSLAIASQVIPFFNAYLAAQNVAYKALTGKGSSPTTKRAAYETLLKTSASVFALSLIYSMMAADDEDYLKKNASIRDRMFVIPGTGGMGIPIRTDMFALPKVLAEHIYLTVTDKGYEDPKKFRQAMWSTLVESVLSPTPVPAAIKPLVEIGMNYNFLQKRPLVGTYLQDKETERQFTESTSELAKVMGQAGLASPIAIDHFIRGMFGSLGGLTLYATNFLISAGSDVERPELSVQDMLATLPGTSGFISKEYENGLKRDFYELRDVVDKAANTMKDIKTRSPEKLEEYLSDEETMTRVGMQKGVAKISEQLTKIRKAIAFVSNTTEMTGSEKKERIKELRDAEMEMLKGLDVKALRQMAMM